MRSAWEVAAAAEWIPGRVHVDFCARPTAAVSSHPCKVVWRRHPRSRSCRAGGAELEVERGAVVVYHDPGDARSFARTSAFVCSDALLVLPCAHDFGVVRGSGLSTTGVAVARLVWKRRCPGYRKERLSTFARFGTSPPAALSWTLSHGR